MRYKKLLSFFACTVMVLTGVVGCSGNKTTEVTKEEEQKSVKEEEEKPKKEDNQSVDNEEITLVFATYENTAETIFKDLELEKKFQEIHPNVKIELETYKDTGEYYKAMAIRATANELPDVMYMKATELTNYSEYLNDISDLECVEDNIFAQQFLVDGKVIGLPTSTGYTCIFYWKDMFEEAGVSVPTTWPEFLDVTQKLQDYFTKENPNFFALAVGAKDAWATYPFAEFMPLVEGGDGSLANTMATMDHPFSPGEDAYEALKKVYTLFNSGVTGPDPLGVGFDQLATLFRAKQVGMNAAGTAFIKQSVDNGVDISEMGAFFLPVRETTDEDFNIVSLADNFLSVPKSSEYTEVAYDFIEFFFEESFYQSFIDYQKFVPTTKTGTAAIDEAVIEATKTPHVQVAQIGGNQDYVDIISEVRFDWKELGASFFVEGFDFEAKMQELNEAWAAARAKHGIK